MWPRLFWTFIFLVSKKGVFLRMRNRQKKSPLIQCETVSYNNNEKKDVN